MPSKLIVEVKVKKLVLLQNSCPLIDNGKVNLPNFNSYGNHILVLKANEWVLSGENSNWIHDEAKSRQEEYLTKYWL